MLFSLVTRFYIVTISAIFSHAFFHEKSIDFLPKPDLKNNSLYGYSLAYQSSNRSLLVSAPAETGVGKIYAINLNTSTNIKEEIYEKLFRSLSLPKDHGFWLGATVRATPNFFVTCAPRYAEKKTVDGLPKFMGLGACFKNHVMMQKIFNSERKLNATEFRHRMDSFGWSIHITPTETDILVGGPAMSTGRAFCFKNGLNLDKSPSLIYKISGKNPVKFNFGYSIESGNFFSSETVYAISTTYGEMGYGKVYFFDRELNNIGAISDTEVGAMFGAALCTANLKGPTLLVGAPASTDDKGSFNVGSVYIYAAQSTGSKQMILKKTIKGLCNNGYFGHNIVNLGDMDGDDNDEISIGAPYDDEGKGAVYIYSGEGILKGKIWKKIQPEGLYSFGFSQTILRDYNDIGCNDLAVGAINSDTVVLFKCMASITVKLESSVTIEKLLNRTGVQIQSCVNVKYPEKLKPVNADLIVDVKITDEKSIFINASTDKAYTYVEEIREKQESFCRNITASNPTSIGEYTQVIAYTIKATLKNNPEDMVYDSSRVFLSERSALAIENDVWERECGVEGCTPKLKSEINSTMLKPYIIGSSKSGQFSLFVSNLGETAYKACAIVKVFGVTITRVPLDCTRLDSTLLGDGEGILCKHKDPIRNGESWNMSNITVHTEYLTSVDEYVKIETNLYNRCDEPNDKQTTTEEFPLIGDTKNISITGKSNPEQTIEVTANDIITGGKVIEHLYVISNRGWTNWIGVDIEILLENATYIRYSEKPIKVYSDMSYRECAMDNSTNTASCNIGDLQKSQTITVVMTMEIIPNTLELNENTPNTTVTTSLNVLKIDKSSSVQTLLSFQKVKVPLWVIITSCVIALLLIFIIAFALYQHGFLKRKNKDKLVELKKNVYRQSVRRSMMRENIMVASRRTNNDREDIEILREDETDRETTSHDK